MKLEAFFENFELLLDAPNGVQKLRELILQHAMQGKLVPQNPNEKPVSVFLERIKSKRELLIKENKIRKSKQFPSIKPEEFPHVLAKGWVWMRLGEIGDWAIGSGFPKSSQGYKDKPLLFCKVSDMNLPGNEKWIRSTQNTIDEEIAHKIKARINPPGTVIFPKIGGAIATNKRRILDKPSAIDNNCLGIISSDLCNIEWLYQLLNSIDFTEFQTGTSIPAINQGTLGMIVIGVPPLEEQKRIVAKVDQFMALCDQLDARQQKKHEKRILLNNAALDKLLTAPTPEEFAQHWQRICDNFDLLYDAPETVGQLRQAILHLAVQGKLVAQDSHSESAAELLRSLRNERNKWLEDNAKENPEYRTALKKLNKLEAPDHPFSIPDSWQFVNLIDCCYLLVDCHNKTAPYSENGIPIIRTTNIRNRQFRMSGLKFVTEKTYLFWSRRCQPEPDDIIFTREAPMGEAAIIPEGAKYCLGQRTMLIRPMHKYILNSYLLITLTEPQLLIRATPEAVGSTVKHLRVGDVERLSIPIPPLEEQHRIVAKVDQLMSLCDELEAGLVQAQTEGGKLMEAVVHHMLAG